jgi:hypothetical protein
MARAPRRLYLLDRRILPKAMRVSMYSQVYMAVATLRDASGDLGVDGAGRQGRENA